MSMKKVWLLGVLALLLALSVTSVLVVRSGPDLPPISNPLTHLLPQRTPIPFTPPTNTPAPTPTPQPEMLYVGAGVSVFALNAATGAREWTYQTGLGPVANGGVGAVTVAGDDVLFLDDTNSSLYAIAQSNGAFLWQIGGVQGPANGGFLVVANGMAIASAPLGQSLNTTTAVNLATGQVAWVQPTGANALAVGVNAVYEAGAYPTSDAEPVTEGFLRAIMPTTGAFLWQQSGPLFSHVALVGNTVYATGGDTLYAFDAMTGAPTWSHQFTEPNSTLPTLALQQSGSMLYVSDTVHLFAVDGSTRQLLWQAPYAASSAAVTNGMVCASMTQQGLFGVNASSGKQRWNLPVSQGGDTLLLAANGLCLTATSTTNDGSPLHAIDAGAGTMRWTQRVPTRDAQVLTHGGTLFLLSREPSAGHAIVRAINETTGSVTWQFDTGSASAGAIALG